MSHLLRFAHIYVSANIIYAQDLPTLAMLVNATFAFDLDCFAKVKCNHKIDKYLLSKQSSGQIWLYEHFCPRGRDVQRLGIELVCSTWQNRSKICNCQYFALAGKRP